MSNAAKDYVDALVKATRNCTPIAYSFLKDHGRSFTKIEAETKLGEQSQCYCNSYRMFLEAGFSYAEGIAVPKGLIPVHHAWCIDTEGQVRDPTWKDAADAQYFGVIFKESFVFKVALEIKVYGILDNLWMLGKNRSVQEVKDLLVSGLEESKIEIRESVS